jgi:drug/metabolite transporter (DMT)-like permease
VSRRADHLVVGISLAAAGMVLLAVLLSGDASSTARLVGAGLLVAAGVLFVVSSRRVPAGPTREPRSSRGRTEFGLLLVLGAVELVLWGVGLPDRSGQWGVATGFLVVGVGLVVAGRRAQSRS